MNQRLFASVAAMLAVSALAACGGGGSTSPGSTLTPSVPASAPSTGPVAAASPTAAPATGAALTTAQLNGAAGFVNAQAHTVYVFDADLTAPGTSVCTGTCATVWPALTVKAKTAYPAPFATIVRSDGTTQLTYAGRPLYTYIADSAAGSVAGDGIVEFGATWHISRP